MKRIKPEDELWKDIHRYPPESLEFKILSAIVEAGGSLPRRDLLKKFVPKQMAYRTFHLKIRSLLDHGLIRRALREGKGRAIYVYELTPDLSKPLFELSDAITRHAFLELEEKAKTNEERGKVLEKLVEDMLSVHRYLILKIVASCLSHPSEEHFRMFMEKLLPYATSHLLSFCLLDPERAREVIDRFLKKTEEEVDKVLKARKRPPLWGGGEKS